MAFTYHGTKPDAWQAVGIALDRARLRVTALWPVRSDGHMGHHRYPGNSEWDVVLVCRPITHTVSLPMAATVEQWVTSVSPVRVNQADRTNFHLAIGMATEQIREAERGDKAVRNANERQQVINDRKQPTDQKHRLWVRNQWRQFDVFEVPVDALVLNADNRRFRAERLWAEEQLDRSLDPENHPDDERTMSPCCSIRPIGWRGPDRREAER